METMNFGDLNNENNINNNSAPEAPNNRNKKLIWAGVILAVLILSVIGWQYWQYIHSTYYQQMKAAKTLEKLYADDTMGGKTPEETLALFLEAVKKEDFDLASQYAIYSAREDVKKWLIDIKENGQMEEFIRVYSQIVKEKGTGTDVAFNVYENNKVVDSIGMNKNSKGIWKIIF